jgi:hypothetical protein
MTCGLPTFATLHGGPAEIIEHGVSGFHIDPYHPEQAANLMADFFDRCKQDPDHWVKISGAGLQRIYEKSVLEILFYSWLVSSQCDAHFLSYVLRTQVHMEDILREVDDTGRGLRFLEVRVEAREAGDEALP